MVKSLRVLHAPADVAGQAWCLSQALRRNGIDSRTLMFNANYIGYESDDRLSLERHRLFLQIWIKARYFFRNVTRFDCFHFYFGESFLPLNLDLLILRLFKKRIFMTFQGTDIRLRTAVGRFLDYNIRTQSEYANRVPDTLKRLKAGWITLLAHKTYVLNPDLLLASPKSIMIPYSNIDLDEWVPTTSLPRPIRAPLRVIHAPTHRFRKGTEQIIAVINNLRSEGHQIELVLCEGMTHQQIKSAGESADLAIDQIRIGWYGGFAVEMMALGVPVLCYLNQQLAPLVPYYDKIPIVNVMEDTLRGALLELLNDHERIRQLQIMSYKFAHDVHDPNKIARMMVNDYQHAT